MTCPCHGYGFVELLATSIREEDAARVPDGERSVRRAEETFIVRVACSCGAGKRWYAVRVAGVEAERANETWAGAIVKVARETGVKEIERVARMMQLPTEFVRAILAEAKRAREASRGEEDQESE